jgi:hypothetical protein
MYLGIQSLVVLAREKEGEEWEGKARWEGQFKRGMRVAPYNPSASQILGD